MDIEGEDEEFEPLPSKEKKVKPSQKPKKGKKRQKEEIKEEKDVLKETLLESVEVSKENLTFLYKLIPIVIGKRSKCNRQEIWNSIQNMTEEQQNQVGYIETEGLLDAALLKLSKQDKIIWEGKDKDDAVYFI